MHVLCTHTYTYERNRKEWHRQPHTFLKKAIIFQTCALKTTRIGWWTGGANHENRGEN
jgi:hypothetical protein